jgi:uncharacterized protein (DUF2267 family)
VFYRTVMRAGGLADLAMCERATAVVFENLRKRLTHAEAEQVCAQLPVALKAVWERGESATRPPLKLDRAETRFPGEPSVATLTRFTVPDPRSVT